MLLFGAFAVRYNSAHSQCAELQRARRHAESASPMGGVPASQVYWAAAPRQARGSALNSNNLRVRSGCADFFDGSTCFL